jgi:hypothetical protein
MDEYLRTFGRLIVADKICIKIILSILLNVYRELQALLSSGLVEFDILRTEASVRFHAFPLGSLTKFYLRIIHEDVRCRTVEKRVLLVHTLDFLDINFLNLYICINRKRCRFCSALSKKHEDRLHSDGTESDVAGRKTYRDKEVGTLLTLRGK